MYSVLNPESIQKSRVSVPLSAILFSSVLQPDGADRPGPRPQVRPHVHRGQQPDPARPHGRLPGQVPGEGRRVQGQRGGAGPGGQARLLVGHPPRLYRDGGL
jgi:hypothetical protein